MIRSVVTVALLIGLAGGVAPAAGVPDDAEALRLLRQAGAAHAVEEDTAKALALLEQALQTAESLQVKGRILVETAYVRWLRLDPPGEIRQLLDQASRWMGGLSKVEADYPRVFLREWRRAKKGRKPRGARTWHLRAAALLCFQANADSRFVTAYGRWKSMPEMRLALVLKRGWGIWLATGSFTFSTTLPVVELNLDGSQRFLALGLSREQRLGDRLLLSLAAGPQWAWIEEGSQLERIKRNATGFLVRADLGWKFSTAVHMLVSLGYGTVRTDVGDRTVVAGGLRLATGLRLQF